MYIEPAKAHCIKRDERIYLYTRSYKGYMAAADVNAYAFLYCSCICTEL